eukprot:Nk52_evm30s262 gene=Nk52_evmTU30s262
MEGHTGASSTVDIMKSTSPNYEKKRPFPTLSPSSSSPPMHQQHYYSSRHNHSNSAFGGSVLRLSRLPFRHLKSTCMLAMLMASLVLVYSSLYITSSQSKISVRQSFYAQPTTAIPGDPRHLTDLGRMQAVVYELRKERDFNPCDVIHLSFVVSGFTSCRKVHTVIKSILFYRKQPLHLHIVADKVGSYILKSLLTTWALPQVFFSFYNLEEYSDALVWLRDSNYNNGPGEVKLILNEVLPPDLEKVIVLNNDIVLNSDIGELWRLFSKFKENQVVGLVENQSKFYTQWLDKKTPNWPAIGQGYNSGIIMYDMKGLNSMAWRQTWTNVVMKRMRVHNKTTLIEQDVLNAVMYEHPHLLFQVPCSWNIQVHEDSLAKACYVPEQVTAEQSDDSSGIAIQNSRGDVKLLHWSRSLNHNTKNIHSEQFKNIYIGHQLHDGHLLSTELIKCPSPKTDIPEDPLLLKRDGCEEFRKTAVRNFRVHPYFIAYQKSTEADNDVTLVTQMSAERFDVLPKLLYHWEGPISIAVYIMDSQVPDLMRHLDNIQRTLKQRKNIGLHLVYKQGEMYPVNTLRNIALDRVLTPYVFIMDGDFLPCFNLHSILRKAVSTTFLTDAYHPEDPKLALVVPAFETSQYSYNFPKGKKDLIKSVTWGNTRPFKESVFPQGHNSTNYTRFYETSTPYEAIWIEAFEPYIVIPSHKKRFDPRFVGYGVNKVSFIQELNDEEYTFMVIPDSFVVHMPHPYSIDRERFNRNPTYKNCVHNVLKAEYLEAREERLQRQAQHMKKLEASAKDPYSLPETLLSKEGMGGLVVNGKTNTEVSSEVGVNDAETTASTGKSTEVQMKAFDEKSAVDEAEHENVADVAVEKIESEQSKMQTTGQEVGKKKN